MDFPLSNGISKPRKGSMKARLALALPLLSLLIFGTVIGARLVGNTTSASAASLVPLSGQIPSVVKSSTVTGSTDPTTQITVVIGLRLRNQDGLAQYIKDTSQAKERVKRSMTPNQLIMAYAPLPSSQQAVINYMQQFGFHTTQTFNHHLLVGFSGTVAQAQRAFHIQINNYRSLQGKTFYAPAVDPSIPAAISPFVQNISGLDSAFRLTHAPVTGPAQKQLQPLAKSSPQTSTPNYCLEQGINYYRPSDVANAYNLSALHNAGLQGEGQTVGLFELDDYSTSEINAYTAACGGGSVPITRIPVNGGTTAGNGAFEVAMDMDLILSAAPHLANLRVYEAANDNSWQANSLLIWGQIVNDAVPVVSTSWGICEPFLNAGVAQQENSLFMLAAAQGQSIFASSGDSGRYGDGCYNIGGGSAYHDTPDDPAAQPYVTGVGGTSLTMNGNSYGSESVWDIAANPMYNYPGAGSGGGVSWNWLIPDWQTTLGLSDYPFYNHCANYNPPHSKNCRQVPDVAMLADSNHGELVYCAAGGCSSQPGWLVGGGTSAAAPMWVAMTALANEQSLRAGSFNLGFLNPLLYQVAQNPTQYSNDFHDITVDNTGGIAESPRPGYDWATGLGSYNAANLANDLVTLAIAQNGSRSAPANTTWYFAEGSVGGSFSEYLTLLNPNASQTATVTVKYLFENQPATTKTYTVAPSTRSTLKINDELGIQPTAPQQAISMIVTSNVPVVAERPMYFSWASPTGPISSGTDVLGATNTTNTTFYFANGNESQTSSNQSNEFITILNPNASAVTVTATYYSGGKQVGTPDQITVDSLHRGTITPNHAGQAAIEVTASQGVVVERPIYVKANVSTAGGLVTGAASTVAATTPGTDWLFAEGHVGPGFQENLVLANFSPNAVTATVKLEHTNNQVQTFSVPISGESQATFDVNQAFNSCNTGPNPCSGDISAEVSEPTGSIVAERVMYFHYNGESGETDVVGEAGPSAHSTYSFAEGYTANSFQEYLTLQNPNANVEVVAITLFFDGTIVQKEVNLAAHSRTTFNINNIVVPVASAYPGGDGNNVSIDVQAFSGTIVVERPIYFDYNNVSPGGTDVIGYTGG